MLGSGGQGEVWLVRHDKTREQRVYKFALDAGGLAGIKREITLSRYLRDTLGEREEFVRLRDWNLEEAPYFLEPLPAPRMLARCRLKTIDSKLQPSSKYSLSSDLLTYHPFSS